MALVPPTPQWINGGALAETPDSGKYTFAYGYKWTQVFEGLYGYIIDNAELGIFNRGYVSNGWIINESRITRNKGSKGRIEIDWQNIYSYVNTDEWSCEAEDLMPRIERHPIFAALSPSDFAAVQRALTALNAGSQASAINQFAGTSNPSLASLLYTKMRNGTENYYLAGARYTWSTFYLPGYMPEPTLGGFTQYPGGPAGYVIPGGISWLRLADDPQLSLWTPVGGITKLTRHWLGGPNGFWDPDIYPPG